MLKSVDTSGKIGSIYVCDRCYKEMNNNTDTMYRITAYTSRTGYYKKDNKWDLCNKCYKALCRGIKKGVPKKDGVDIQLEQKND